MEFREVLYPRRDIFLCLLLGELHERHTEATRIWVTILAFAHRQRKTMRSVCQDGRPQGFPDTRLIPSCLSGVSKGGNPR
jgi:hypothetical protein